MGHHTRHSQRTWHVPHRGHVAKTSIPLPSYGWTQGNSVLAITTTSPSSFSSSSQNYLPPDQVPPSLVRSGSRRLVRSGHEVGLRPQVLRTPESGDPFPEMLLPPPRVPRPLRTRTSRLPCPLARGQACEWELGACEDFSPAKRRFSPNPEKPPPKSCQFCGGIFCVCPLVTTRSQVSKPQKKF